MATYVRYEADGWGVGELVFEGERLAWHALPGQVRGTVPGTGPQGRRLRDSPSAQRLAVRLTAFFAGEPVEFGDVALVDDGWTDFRRACVDALRGLPRGEVVTYAELAALAGSPRAQRATGTVCAENAFPIVVPCHRVVSAAGIGPYGSLGSEYKRRLLALEDVVL